MNSEEIEQIIIELRKMLNDNGFDWIVADVDAAEWTEADSLHQALALIKGVESVMVGLAKVENAAIKQLKVEEIIFKPDTDLDDGSTLASSSVERIHGQQRRDIIVQLIDSGDLLRELRDQISGAA